MKTFDYTRANSTEEAISVINKLDTAMFLGGGTNLIDLMKEGVEQPDHLIDVTRLSFSAIEELPDGGVRIGAMARNSDTANHPLIRQRYPVLSQAFLAGASPQLRNMATVGGNLMQRTRCYYFTDTAMPCNKREPGSGCAAIEGYNRIHAILGASQQCIATHPSDMCVALAALDAVVRVQGANGEREIALVDFHRLPGDTPEIETELQPGELITAIDLPANDRANKSYYLKVRDRTSYAFALVSVAAVLELQNNTIQNARIAMGGVAHKPWRATETEAMLVGKPANEDTFRQAAEITLAEAQTYEHNAFKVELGKRAIVRALSTVASA
jgi:xanthine dehydrogenase YagS FAD-binding subunit